MSARAIGLVKTISVFSLRVTRSLPSTVMALPSTALIVPRTRVCATAALAATSNATKKTLVRRLDAIFAHVEALGDDLAVGFLARVGPDPFAALEVGARAGIEGDDRCARRHENFLRSALVVEGDLVAAARLRDAVQVRVGHGRFRLQVPRKMAGFSLRRDGMHLERGHLAGLLDRGDADVLAFQLLERALPGGGHRHIRRQVQLEVLAFARLDRKHVTVKARDFAAHAGRGLRESG